MAEVHLYAPCWNEAALLPHFLRHYEPWVSRFVIFDDGSDDGSRELLEAHPQVDVRPFERSDADSFTRSITTMFNEEWKSSRGAADWVVLADVDEMLHVGGRAMPDYLDEQRRQGVTVIPALGFDLNHPTWPTDSGRLVDVVRRGRPRVAFNKLAIFDPDAVEEVDTGFGRHVSTPTGRVLLPALDALMLWHYKHLDYVRWTTREDAMADRLGASDREGGLGSHYLWSDDERRTFWRDMEAESFELGGQDFESASLAIGPLWWDAYPRVASPRPPATPAS